MPCPKRHLLALFAHVTKRADSLVDFAVFQATWGYIGSVSSFKCEIPSCISERSTWFLEKTETSI